MKTMIYNILLRFLEQKPMKSFGAFNITESQNTAHTDWCSCALTSAAHPEPKNERETAGEVNKRWGCWESDSFVLRSYTRGEREDTDTSARCFSPSWWMSKRFHSRHVFPIQAQKTRVRERGAETQRLAHEPGWRTHQADFPLKLQNVNGTRTGRKQWEAATDQTSDQSRRWTVSPALEHTAGVQRFQTCYWHSGNPCTTPTTWASFCVCVTPADTSWNIII